MQERIDGRKHKKITKYILRWEEIKGEKGEGLSGTCVKDTWTKPKGGRIKGGKCE